MKREDNRTDPQLKLRLPAPLKRKLDAAARALKRPVGNEIIARLEASFVQGVVLEGASAGAIEARLAAIEGRLAKLEAPQEISTDALSASTELVKNLHAELAKK